MSYYERNNPYTGLSIVLGAAAGVLIGNAFFGSTKADDNKNIKTYQQYNAEIGEQLHERPGVPDQIQNLLVTQDDHFTFGTIAEDGHQEMCSGDYAVKQAKAVLSGSITCQETVTLQ